MTKATQAKRFRRLADYIERQPKENFDQGTWDCGSAACVAGHCVAMVRKKYGWYSRIDSIPGRAARYLFGVERWWWKYSAARKLFDGGAPWQTRDAAVAELRRRAKVLERQS